MYVRNVYLLYTSQKRKEILVSKNRIKLSSLTKYLIQYGIARVLKNLNLYYTVLFVYISP